MRSKPAVPIGGKYRLIDVPISNCLHADLRLINARGVPQADGEGYYIRSGIIIVPKDATIPRGFAV